MSRPGRTAALLRKPTFEETGGSPPLFSSGDYRSDGRIETVNDPMLVSLLNEMQRQEAETL